MAERYSAGGSSTCLDDDISGVTVAAIALGMGLGELGVMTLVARLGVLVTSQPPANGVTAWELADQLSAGATRHPPPDAP